MTSELAETEALPHQKPGQRASLAWLLVRVGLSLAVLAFAWIHIDAGALTNANLTIDLPFLIAALPVLVASIIIVALRWTYLSHPGAPISRSAAISMIFASQFAGQVLPSSLGQDAVRAFLATRGRNNAHETVSIIVLDRLCGLIGLAALIFLGLPRLVSLAGITQSREAALLAGGFAALALFGALTLRLIPPPSFLPVLLGNLWLAGQRAARMLTSAKGAAAIGISMVIQGLIALSIWMIVRSLGNPLSFADGLVTIPAAIFVANMPISVNGWGVREGAMVVTLGFAGVPATHAFFASILFGVAQLIVSLPGAWALISLRRKP